MRERSTITTAFLRFVRSESAGGIVLLFATVVALILANSSLAQAFHRLWQYRLGLSIHHWINDGLMAIFFLLVGLEIKRELVSGELASARRAALPAIAALGGMVVPAILYVAVARGTPYLRGWGIPMATDIAFAVGVLTLLGDRVPNGLRVFVTALAIVDDIGAVLVIAIFYSSDLSFAALGVAVAVVAALVVMNRAGVLRVWPYLVAGVALWLAILNSGIHATISGVILAMAIPCGPERLAQSPLHRLEHALEGWVAFLILPLFALSNAGVSLPWADLTTALAHPITLGIGLGLFLGKQLGVLAATALAVRFGIAELPDRTRWTHVYGGAVLAGIGFTMSIFIANLAFSDDALLDRARIGILGASVCGALAGALVLLLAGDRRRRHHSHEQS